MNFVAIIEIINFFLATTAAIISFGILNKVAKNLAASWRLSFIAFLILAMAMMMTAVYQLGLRSLAGINTELAANLAHFVFVIVAFFGLFRYYQILKRLCRRGV